MGFIHFENYIVATLKIFFKSNGKSIKNIKKMSFNEKIIIINNYLDKKLDLELIEIIKEANKIRNSIMHNNCISLYKIGERYKKGDTSKLSSIDVNSLGLKAREIASIINRCSILA